QAAFYVPKNDIPATGASLYREQTAHYLGERARVVKLTTRRLDTLATEHDLPSPDLVKLEARSWTCSVARVACCTLAAPSSPRSHFCGVTRARLLPQKLSQVSTTMDSNAWIFAKSGAPRSGASGSSISCS